MEIMSRIKDYRINSINLYVETTFGEYLSFADQIIKNNELQRKRVKTSKSVYSLLKDDLKKGCVMPPLVLAVTKTDVIDADEIDEDELLEYIKENRLPIGMAFLHVPFLEGITDLPRFGEEFLSAVQEIRRMERRM